MEMFYVATVTSNQKIACHFSEHCKCGVVKSFPQYWPRNLRCEMRRNAGVLQKVKTATTRDQTWFQRLTQLRVAINSQEQEQLLVTVHDRLVIKRCKKKCVGKRLHITSKYACPDDRTASVWVGILSMIHYQMNAQIMNKLLLVWLDNFRNNRGLGPGMDMDKKLARRN